MTAYSDTAPADFQRRVHKALKCWHDNHPKEGQLDDLLIARRSAAGKVMTRRQSTNHLLEQGLVQLAQIFPSDVELLDLRFCTCLHVRETRQHVHYAESTIYSKQNQAIARLAALLYRLELAARQERAACLEGRLETPPVVLVGLDTQVTQLAALLASQQGPWLLSIEGMGGIGKTTLAAAVLRRMARTTSYESFGWVSAQVAGLDLCGQLRSRPQPTVTADAVIASLARQLLPAPWHHTAGDTGTALDALRVHLRQCPHLIVVDNWETVIDHQVLLPLLHSLANPSKFIFTSRRRLVAESGVHLHYVPELGEADALLLLRQAARAHELAPVAASEDYELLPIYAAVGGNPLALMLVLYQTHVRPLHSVVGELAGAHLAPLETVFAFVLQQVWMGLGELERRVLRVMPLIERRQLGLDAISALCGQTAVEIAGALQRLMQASLIFTTGDLAGCHYQMPTLARTLVRKLNP